MKKYDRIMAAFLLTYLVTALLLAFVCRDADTREDAGYKVEINQIVRKMEEAGAFAEPDLREKQYVKAVSFLPVGMVSGAGLMPEPESGAGPELKSGLGLEAEFVLEPGSEPVTELTHEQAQGIRDFYRNHNGVSSTVYPLFLGDRLAGYVRFDYTMQAKGGHILWIAEGILFVSWAMIFAVLWYVRQKILRPFHAVSEMPYELAKGHMQVDVEEDKGKFFGKFIWGISMLRDTLDASRDRALKLEKEKKLLLLSISHDIKIPLSAIRLYARALREGVYQTRSQQADAAAQIENHAQEIEEFVKEIVNTASEDILEIDVIGSEFYLKDYIDKIREIYEPKCRIAMTGLVIGRYGNKLLRGDMDRAVEAMENLLENAMKYGDGRLIRIDFHEEDYCQVIEVFNTGIPVAQKEMPHLFDSFYRGGNAQDKSGSGLGLYISRQIMRKMEGDIFAERKADGMSFGLVFGM